MRAISDRSVPDLGRDEGRLIDTTELTSTDQTSTVYDGFISYSHAADGLPIQTVKLMFSTCSTNRARVKNLTALFLVTAI